MDEARRVGQAVPKYTTQAQAAVARASRLGGSWQNHGKTMFFTWFYNVFIGIGERNLWHSMAISCGYFV